MNNFRLAGVLLLSFVFGEAAMACPDYLKGEYRKLHSAETVDLCQLAEAKPLLVVNTASHCGYTKQFEGLEALYQKYRNRGLVVVGFASNDFNQEAKNEEESASVCFVNFGVTFTMLAPTPVKGPDANPLFKALAEQTSAPQWNFNKYLVDKKGQVVKHFGSSVAPDSRELVEAIEQAL